MRSRSVIINAISSIYDTVRVYGISRSTPHANIADARNRSFGGVWYMPVWSVLNTGMCMRRLFAIESAHTMSYTPLAINTVLKFMVIFIYFPTIQFHADIFYVQHLYSREKKINHVDLQSSN